MKECAGHSIQRRCDEGRPGRAVRGVPAARGAGLKQYNGSFRKLLSFAVFGVGCHSTSAASKSGVDICLYVYRHVALVRGRYRTWNSTTICIVSLTTPKLSWPRGLALIKALNSLCARALLTAMCSHQAYPVILYGQTLITIVLCSCDAFFMGSSVPCDPWLLLGCDSAEAAHRIHFDR